ncbi:MAG: FkbM family methyltransferase [Pyrinomonadaceae bacterium]
MSGSMFGQDRFVLDVLDGMRGGFFLDSGASDGVKGSNTLLLESSYGWSGICVEPNPGFFAELVRNRRCHCVNCCLYHQEGEVDFVEADVLGGILKEYHPQLLQQAKTAYLIPEDDAGRPMTVVRPARTVRSVLRECGAPPVIDYWSLDTEGSEPAILKSFPFDEYSFRVITVEHNWFPAREEIKGILESRGYRRIKELAVDDCYVKDVTLPQSSWRSKVWRRRN